MNYETLILLVALAMSAFLYASVGHGGASAYLAILVIAGLPTVQVKPIALILNGVVSCTAAISYAKPHFSWKRFWPFAITSVPAAYLAAQIHLDTSIFKWIVGVILWVPVLVLSGIITIQSPVQQREIPLGNALVIGLIIGVISGLIGMGGGILLSPILLLRAWAGAQQAAAISSVFIFINSMAGLLSLQIHGFPAIPNSIFWMIPAVLIPGFVGSKWGSSLKNELNLRRLLAFVLLLASVKLLFA